MQVRKRILASACWLLFLTISSVVETASAVEPGIAHFAERYARSTDLSEFISQRAAVPADARIFTLTLRVGNVQTMAISPAGLHRTLWPTRMSPVVQQRLANLSAAVMCLAR